MGHLSSRKVRLVLSSMQVLGHGFFFIVLDSIWPDIGEKVRFFGRLKMFSSLVWLILWNKTPCRPHNAKLRLYTY